MTAQSQNTDLHLKIALENRYLIYRSKKTIQTNMTFLNIKISIIRMKIVL